MSNKCGDSGIALCSKTSCEWKPSFRISATWENKMILYSSNVCNVYPRFLNIYPEQLYLEEYEGDHMNINVETDHEWYVDNK